MPAPAWPYRWDDVLAAYLEPAQRQRLAAACIGIAGAGGLGSNCAMLLARCGIGRIIVADDDVVSLSNLNRQYFLPGHLGQPKVEALASILREINPDLVIEPHRVRLEPATVSGLFASCEVVVEAVDEASTKKMLLESLIQASIFVVGASGLAGWGGSPMIRRELGNRAVIVGDALNGIETGLPPLAPRVMMAAAMQANEVLAAILGPCPQMQNLPSPQDIS